MIPIDSLLPFSFRESSKISSGTICSEKQNHIENRNTTVIIQKKTLENIESKWCNLDGEVRKPCIYMYFVSG